MGKTIVIALTLPNSVLEAGALGGARPVITKQIVLTVRVAVQLLLRYVYASM